MASMQGSLDQPIDDLEQEILQFIQPLVITEDTIHRLASQFSIVYKHLALTSNEQFLPTPVTSLPSGSEVGEFLAIDVGGSNLRVAFIELLGDGVGGSPQLNGIEGTIKHAQRPRVRRTLQKEWPIANHLKVDQVDDLFAWIGDCVAEVVGDYLSNESGQRNPPKEIDMGITFSFPMLQHNLNSATLMPMGKGFTITENTDLGSTLLRGYERHTKRASSEDGGSSRAKRRKLGPLPSLRIAAITNDTIATFTALAYSVKSLPNSRVAAGLIVGTGCNATVPIKFSKLGQEKTRYVRESAPNATETVVNTEFTIAGACEPLQDITTPWDQALDKGTARPGFQPLEYMTGGRYIGELIRIILLDYMSNTHQPNIDLSSLPDLITTPYSLTTKFVSTVVATAKSNLDLAKQLSQRLPAALTSDWTWSAHTAGAFRKIAHAVQLRSAGLIAATTIGLLAAAGEIDIPGQDGPVYSTSGNYHPQGGKGGGVAATTGTSDLVTGPEELVVAFTGGIIQHYPNFKEQCQKFIDKLLMKCGPQQGGKSVFLRESRDGGIIGAGVLAGMESQRLGQ